MKKTSLIQKMGERIMLIGILFGGAVLHAVNMFHFPYFENDEGVYMSQAWSLITQGKLAPYTYWYDHAPLGWMLIALWTLLTGGFFTFGFSINSGRVLMLALHIFSSLFLYLSAKKLTSSKAIAAGAAIIFSITPLGIYFQRRVLLDNIMIFWVLFSLFLLLYNNGKLIRIFGSALAFGIAVLSKENAIFFLPVLLYTVLVYSSKAHRSFAAVGWISIVSLTVSLYFVYALLKGELFPSGTLLGGEAEHVSLIGTMREQFGRDGGGILDPSKSSFWNHMSIWISEDPLIIIIGALSTIITFFLGIRNIGMRLISLFTISFWLFLLRGGIVIEFYIIPLIPFLSLCIAAVLVWMSHIISFVVPKTLRQTSYALLLFLLICSYSLISLSYATTVRNNHNLFTSDQTTPQIQAIEWLIRNNEPNAFIVIDNYGYVDLQTKGKGNFRHAEWYWKVDRDPDIREGILNQNPQNIDYIALTPQMEQDLKAAGLELTGTAWSNASPVIRFWKDGWGVEFWATKTPSRILASSWNSYKKSFIHTGRVIDPSGQLTTSEGQSYAMLRAVWMNDQETFDEVWQWTKQYMQLPSSLFAWRVKEQNGQLVRDEGSAADGDQDIALALLFAYKRWGIGQYLLDAQDILNGIWNEEIVFQQGRPVLAAGNWAKNKNPVILNPSYFSPSHYRIFSEADLTHPWSELVTTSYEFLEKCIEAPLDKNRSVSLPPNWCAVTENGEITNSPEQSSSTDYSYDAFRTMWRLALDYMWFGEKRAKDLIDKMPYLLEQWKNGNIIYVGYTHDGTPWETYESASSYGANIGYFLIKDRPLAEKIYQEKVEEKFYNNKDSSYWEDPQNYYTQNWAWFGTALMANATVNLWDETL